MSFKTITGSTKGQLIKGIPPVGGGGGGGTVTSVISSDNTLTITNGAGPAVDTSVAPIDITIAGAQALVGGGVIPNRWYRITDSSQVIDPTDQILVWGADPKQFSQAALYIDNKTTAGVNRITFDVITDVMSYREDLLGNQVYFASGVKNANFPWGNTLWSRNIFSNSLVVADTGNSLLVKNSFDSASLSITQDSVVLIDNKILRTTALEIDQNSATLIGNTFQANGTFTFTVDSFWDSVVNNTIILSGGSFTNGVSDPRNQMYGCRIIDGGSSVNTATEIVNTSLVLLTNETYINNIFTIADLSDASIFSGGIISPTLACGYAGNFILTGASGVNIVGIASGGARTRLYPQVGETYTLRHVPVASIGVGSELVRSAGAGDLVLVGRTNVLDYAEYENAGLPNGAWILLNFVKLT